MGGNLKPLSMRAIPMRLYELPKSFLQQMAIHYFSKDDIPHERFFLSKV